jgi:hypothetical protein
MILFYTYHSVVSVVATACCVTVSVSPSVYLYECNNGYNIEFSCEHRPAQNNVVRQSYAGQARWQFYSKELSSYIPVKCCEILEMLRGCWRLEKDSGSWG